MRSSTLPGGCGSRVGASRALVLLAIGVSIRKFQRVGVLLEGGVEDLRQLALGVRLGLVEKPAGNGLLLASLDALSAKGVGVLHRDGVEDVVVLLEHAALVHVGRVRDDEGLVKRHVEQRLVRLVLLELRSGEVYACLDGARIAISEALLGERNVKEVKEVAVGVCHLVDYGIVLRRAYQLTLLLHAREDHAGGEGLDGGLGLLGLGATRG